MISRKSTVGLLGAGLAGAFLLAGCASFGNASDVFGNLLAFHSTKAPPTDPSAVHAVDVGCPEISVDDGAGALRVYAGADHSSNGVKYQIDIAQFARQCDPENGQLAIKVGVRGRLVVGPAGSAGAYVAPVKISITRQSDGAVVVSKLYQTSVASQGDETTFQTISDPLLVPIVSQHADQDYAIGIGLQQPADAAPKTAKARRPRKTRG